MMSFGLVWRYEMAKPVSLSRLIFRLLPIPLTRSTTRSTTRRLKPPSFSTTSTPFPLQYDLIISRPTQSSLDRPRRPPRAAVSDDPSPEDKSDELGFDTWLDTKLSSSSSGDSMEKSKRKYYNKRRKRMHGGDSEEEEERRREEERLVEMKPEVVEFNTLHKREEELYFYDTFAYPWEKDKHYKMTYQLEKKYYPDQCLDKAFVQPGDEEKKKLKTKKTNENEDERGMVFFEEEKKAPVVAAAKEVKEVKVEEFFKCLKKAPSEKEEEKGDPYLLTRMSELPARWDGPYGTVVLINKPKGWTSFTVCGKLRRLVKVKKVGHAGTLDPMATGLLIVCVGKATKIVDSYQGMTKGYSGVFRLGEATSTWDADSPVIQRMPWEDIKDEDIKKAAASFCGEIWQVPPMFSAIKVGGEKLYEKARRGESIELSPRRISIYKFEIERSLDDRQNLIFRVTCSKGTYIRSLCADLGKALGSCAHLTALRRDSIGEYSADHAWDFKELEDAITKTYF